MKNVERMTSIKNELLELFMGMEVAEHTQRRRSAAQRNLRARRGIELHRESQKLSRDIAPLPEDEEVKPSALH
ncbi:PA3496 family putative envelope integrity protein [Halomonas sp. HNIBRBA4712]|uniref:PA3496 family putative envelope integrity protein n=1 Tax=Halomonas sp. HNIBRBA4712 TaxID=3373087 RepID=UPI003746DD45